jgi:hypothetical protein
LVGLGQTWISSAQSKNRNVIYLGGLVWLIFLGIQTNLRTDEWKDSDSTKSNVIKLIEKKHEEEETDPLFNLIEHE